MPRDGSGNYSLPAGNPVVTGTTIDSSWANNTMDDIATEIQDSLSRSGKGGMLVAFPFADGSVSAPGQSWSNESTSGMYRAGTNDVRYSIAGVDRIQLRANNTEPFRIWNVTQAAWQVPLNEGGTYTVTGDWTFSGTVDINGPLPLDGATITGLNAVDVDIADAGGYFTATDVEGALQEVWTDLASNANALGASLVGIEDAGTIFTGTDVEAALQETQTAARLASNSNGLGASLIGIEDAAGYFDDTTVELALKQAVGILKIKDGNTSRASTTTLTDDPDLAGFSLKASRIYKIEGLFSLTCSSATPDFKWTFQFDNAPSSSFAYWHIGDGAGGLTTDNGTLTSSHVIQHPGTGNVHFHLVGYIATSANPTVVDFQWAQNISNASSMLLNYGNWIKITETIETVP